MDAGSSPVERRTGMLPTEVQDFGEAAFELPPSLPKPAPVEIREFAAELVDFAEVSAATTGDTRSQSSVAADSSPSQQALTVAVGRVGLVRRTARGLARLVRTLWGIFSLIVLLACIAAIPVVNFLALGYLLEEIGRAHV